MTVSITPETKVGALLDAYPGIEESLIAWVPAFSKLKNPLLRRTVAKVATLEQAAKVGGIGVKELVQRLREATGQRNQPEFDVLNNTGHRACSQVPDWVIHGRVTASLDADALLETGEHPLGCIHQALAGMKAGELFRLKSSFRPEPLLDAMQKAGHLVHSRESSPGTHETLLAVKG